MNKYKYYNNKHRISKKGLLNLKIFTEEIAGYLYQFLHYKIALNLNLLYFCGIVCHTGVLGFWGAIRN
jgi:hypothetical protein